MLEKLMLHLAASQLAQAAAPGQGISDPMQRQVATCQAHVNYYEWLRQTLVDPAWPTPQIDPAWLIALLKAALGTATTPTTPTTPTTLPTTITPAISAKMAADPAFSKMRRINPLEPKG